MSNFQLHHHAFKALRLAQERMGHEAVAIFTPSGNTTDGSTDISNTAILPEPAELAVRVDSMLGLVEIVRKTQENVVVAGASITDGTDLDRLKLAATNWITHYTMASRPERAEMLDVADPHNMTPMLMQAILTKPNTASGSYRPKIATTTVTTAEQAKQTGTVAFGQSVTGKKRITWNSHSGFSLARWCGAQGMTNAQAIHVFTKIGMTKFGQSAIIGGVYAGKKGERGAPAQLSSTEARQLLAIANELTVPQDGIKPPPTVIVVESPKPVAKKLTKKEKQLQHEKEVAIEVQKRKQKGAR